MDDSALLTVTLTADAPLWLNSIAGLTFLEGDGAADETMTFQGSVGDINMALLAVMYAPRADFSGIGHIAHRVDDGDNVVEGSLDVNIRPVADEPVFTIAAPGAGGIENQPVTLPAITAAASDTDGSETVWLALSGFPQDTVFSEGSLDNDMFSLTFEKWVISGRAVINSLDEVPLTMTLPADFTGSFTLEVIALVSDGATLTTGEAFDLNTVTQQIAITIDDAPAATGIDAAALARLQAASLAAGDFLI